MTPTKPVDRQYIQQCTVTDVNGCWIWQRAITAGGYGSLRRGEHRYAHRASWTVYRGLIPAGMVIDHLCRNTACCNPLHLEPVTQKVNTQRGLAPSVCGENMRAKTHCPRGHLLQPWPYKSGTRKRYCRTCVLAQQRAKYHQLKA